MKVTETTVRSSMASSQMTGQINSITSELHRGSLKSMKEFGGEKPSFWGSLHESFKFICSKIWGFLCFVFTFGNFFERRKIAHNRVEVSNLPVQMMNELGKCDWYEVTIGCGGIRTDWEVSDKEIFPDAVDKWFQKLEKKDQRGELTIFVYSVNSGTSWDRQVKVGDCIKIYSSTAGKSEYSAKKDLSVFEGLKEYQAYGDRLDHLVFHYQKTKEGKR
ncbi:MAG: hypothetical protein K1000chlam2_01814 [Chlamydiae bacterium]|nr:hypothetical protein [Chlamydiota bacterium]